MSVLTRNGFHLYMGQYTRFLFGQGRNVTRVVNIRHSCYDVYIGRGSIWGNPFIIGRDGTRLEVVEKYRDWIIMQPKLMAQLHTLQDKRLGCYCYPKACHGDVLVALLEYV